MKSLLYFVNALKKTAARSSRTLHEILVVYSCHCKGLDAVDKLASDRTVAQFA